MKKNVTYVGWRITERCNLHCPFCFSTHSRIVKEMYPKKVKEGLRVLKKADVRAIGVMGGEPLVFPEVDKIIEMIKELKFELILSTNGLLLEKFFSFLERKINWLSLSLDSDKPQANDCFRSPGHFDKVVGFIRKYDPNKTPFRLKINTVVHKENYKHLNGIGRFLEGKKVVWKLLQFTPRALGKKNKKRFWISLEEFENLVGSLKDRYPEIRIVSRKYDQKGDLDSFLVRPNGDILVTYKENPEEELKKCYREGYLRIGNILDPDILGKISRLEKLIPQFYQENWREFSESYVFTN